MVDVVLDELKRNLMQGLVHGRELGQDVEAIRVVLDHAGDAADLPFDAPQPVQQGRLVLRIAVAGVRIVMR